VCVCVVTLVKVSSYYYYVCVFVCTYADVCERMLTDADGSRY
jgi:hypothetical protein